jgi:hypothetical protein
MLAGKVCRDPQCFVLIGYKDDTQDKATQRLEDTVRAGFMPYAMLYRDERGKRPDGWRQFQRSWLRPAAVRSRMKALAS